MFNEKDINEFDTEFKRQAVVKYLARQAMLHTGRGIGYLDVIAALTKVPEGYLHDVVAHEQPLFDEVMYQILQHIPAEQIFTNEDVLGYLQHHADNGRLNTLADSVGVGEMSLLWDAIHRKSVPDFLRMQIVTAIC